MDSRDEKIIDRFYEEPEETLKRVDNYEDLFD